MNMLHVYRGNAQPATKWVDTHSGEPIQMGFEPDALLWCSCCDKQRAAKDCVVYSYYDGAMIYCADGNGCKDPLVIAEKKANEFARRSAGQKRRFASLHGNKSSGNMKM